MTTPIRKVWAGTTGRAVERGQHPGRARIAARTLRTDNWRRAPLITFIGLGLFVVYGTVRAFWAVNYYAAPYLSPFYSPCITTGCVPEASDFGQPISWWPLSPALLILVFPLGLPAHLLLLPQGLLPLVLAVPAGLRGGRAAQAVHR